MISYINLTNAIVDTLRRVPPLVLALGGSAAAISGYIDGNPEPNSVTNAIYQMQPGSVLVAWEETMLSEGEMEAWLHQFAIIPRPARGDSAMHLIDLIVNGVPDPGDGLRWRYCPVMNGVLPALVPNILKPMDEEGIDYFTIVTQFKETGDT